MRKGISLIRDLNAKLQQLSFSVFCLIIFLLRIPPFYILPINSPFLNSHSIARYFLTVLCISILFLLYQRKIEIKLNKRFEVLLFLYFVTQSLSIIGATNIFAFLLMYKNIIFSLLILFAGMILISSEKRINTIVKILVLSVFVDLAYQFLVYFTPSIAFSYLKPFVYEQYWEVVEMNFRRQRYFVDIYDSALIPLFLYFILIEKKVYEKVFSALAIISVFFFALVSNFRTHILIAFLSTVSSIKVTFSKSSVFIMLLTAIVILFTGYQVIVNNVGYDAFDRLVSPVQEDYQSLRSRLSWWQESVNMAISSPFFGVGLGNFYDNLRSKSILKLSLFDWQNKFDEITMTDPHNFFFETLAETGILGFLAFTAMLLYFLTTDILKLMKHEKFLSLFIVSFWALFLFALFNPPNTVQYLSLFWILRVLIFKKSLLHEY